jgi:putative mRNA 3-end processing factor
VRIRFTPGDGLEIAGVPFTMDAGHVRPVGVVSHAHTDHAARHKKIIATPETALLLGERWKRLTVRAIPFDQPVGFEGTRLTLLGSGHILGAAMVLVEYEATRLLYTGDLRTTDSLLFTGARPVACDILVTEATFGRPEYNFPPIERVRQLLRAFVEAARASGYTPVLTGYALGKAQELVALLGEYRETVWVHPKIARYCELYRKAGIDLPPVEVPSAGAPAGALVVMPPNFGRTEWRDRITKPRTCFCSGWAQGKGHGGWHAADQMVPFSDHADCKGLIDFALATGARKVYTLHGFAGELAEGLRARGMDAQMAPLQWDSGLSSTAPQFSTESLDLFKS